MCEFCGCGEPVFRSVAVILPSAEEPESDTPEADTFSQREEDEAC